MSENDLFSLIQSSPFFASYQQQGGAGDLFFPWPPGVYIQVNIANTWKLEIPPCKLHVWLKLALLRYAWFCQGGLTDCGGSQWVWNVFKCGVRWGLL